MNENSQQILITVTGPDVPGITSGLMGILNREGVRLLDVEQAVTHQLLSLSLLVQFRGAEIKNQAVLKDLLFKAKELGVNLDFKIVEGDTAVRSAKDQYAITLMGEVIQPRHFAAVSAAIAKADVNIDSIRKLNDRGVTCLELITYTESQVDLEALKEDLLNVAARFPSLDIAIQKESLYRRAKRLVVMDMDSTLIQVEVIDEMAKLSGSGDKVASITAQAMEGEIEFDESLKQRTALLKGLKEQDLLKLSDEIPLTPGAELLVEMLKKLGYKIALISGGFSYFGEKLKAQLGLDYVYTNHLEIEGGTVTGKLKGEIVNAQKKADLLEQIAKEEGVPLESVVAIGDGANDIPMLKKAGLGVAFNAKRKTREEANAAVNQNSLASILFLLGITEQDIEEKRH